MKIFEHYLTAYRFCIDHGIPPDMIVKKSFKQWSVDVDIEDEA